ncbi:tetratricopeptide repeat protein [Clostridium sp. LBM24168]
MENILREIDKNINLEDNFSKLISMCKNDENTLNRLFKLIDDDIVENKVDVLNTLGALCYSRGIFEVVIPILDRALRYDNSSYAVLMNLSEVSFDIGEYKMALEYLGNIKEESEERDDLIKKVEEKYNFQRKIKFALRRIENSICENEAIEYILKQLADNKIDDRYIINIVNRDIIKKVYILNYVAMKCFDFKLYHCVMPLLNRAIEIEPGDVESIYNIGRILYTFGEKERAIKYLSKIKGINSEIDKFIMSIER